MEMYYSRVLPQNIHCESHRIWRGKKKRSLEELVDFLPWHYFLGHIRIHLYAGLFVLMCCTHSGYQVAIILWLRRASQIIDTKFECFILYLKYSTVRCVAERSGSGARDNAPNLKIAKPDAAYRRRACCCREVASAKASQRLTEGLKHLKLS